MGEALAGTQKPILVTSGVGVGTPLNGCPATEGVLNPRHANPRIATEFAGAPLIAEARRAGAVAYLGEGQTRCPRRMSATWRSSTS